MDASTTISVLRHLCALAQCAVAWKLIRTRSASTYRVFFWWNIFSIARWAYMTVYPSDRVAWSWGEEAHVFLLGAVLWELFAFAAARYPHQTRYCTTALMAAMAIAFALCWWGDVKVFSSGTKAVREAMYMRRYFSSAYLVTILFSFVFFNLVPAPMPRNLKLHQRLMACYCATYACGYYMIHLDPVNRPWASIVLMAAVTTIYAVYAIEWRSLAKEKPAESRPTRLDGLYAEFRTQRFRAALKTVSKGT